MARMDLNSIHYHAKLHYAMPTQVNTERLKFTEKCDASWNCWKERVSVEKSRKQNKLKTENTCFWQWQSRECKLKTVCHRGHCPLYTNRSACPPPQHQGMWKTVQGCMGQDNPQTENCLISICGTNCDDLIHWILHGGGEWQLPISLINCMMVGSIPWSLHLNSNNM